MTTLLHPRPPIYITLARATAFLNYRHEIIEAINEAANPDLKISKKDTLRFLDHEFEKINSEIEFINEHTTSALRFKPGGRDLTYTSYVAALEICTELLIHMESWTSWHKLKLQLRRTKGIQDKNLPNDLIYKNEVNALAKSLGRRLSSHDYPKWRDQLLKNNASQRVSKKTRKDPKDGTPINPDPNEKEDPVNDKWREPTLRKKFKEITGCDAKTKKLSPLKS